MQPYPAIFGLTTSPRSFVIFANSLSAENAAIERTDDYPIHMVTISRPDIENIHSSVLISEDPKVVLLSHLVITLTLIVIISGMMLLYRPFYRGKHVKINYFKNNA